jgi:hypothetical protein
VNVHSLSQAQNAEGYAWKGVLAGGVGAAAELFSSNGEVSIGQRMACNASTVEALDAYAQVRPRRRFPGY